MDLQGGLVFMKMIVIILDKGSNELSQRGMVVRWLAPSSHTSGVRALVSYIKSECPLHCHDASPVQRQVNVTQTSFQLIL